MLFISNLYNPEGTTYLHSLSVCLICYLVGCKLHMKSYRSSSTLIIVVIPFQELLPFVQIARVFFVSFNTSLSDIMVKSLLQASLCWVKDQIRGWKSYYVLFKIRSLTFFCYMFKYASSNFVARFPMKSYISSLTKIKVNLFFAELMLI